MKAAHYRIYLLAVLLVIYAFNNSDRLVLGLLLQDIKRDLALSDTQLGLLTGIAFSLFYALLGLPLSRWADRGDRVHLICVTTVLWSVAVALSGFAANFGQLLFVRVGAAVGEAGCLPAAVSMIAEYFSRAERPRAMALYFQGGTLSVATAYFVGGWVNQLYGWRATVKWLGLPGIALAALAWLSLREARRKVIPARERNMPLAPGTPPPFGARETPERHNLRTAIGVLWSQQTFRSLLLFYGITSFFNTGILQWQPTYLVRSYGFQTGTLGTWLALIFGVGTMVGTYVGGEWASRRAAGNESLQLKAMAIVYASVGLIAAFTYLTSNKYLALASLFFWCAAGTVAIGPVLATLQTLVPEHTRATAISIIYLFANLIGMGLGPLAAGSLSDVLRPLAGVESLRYALLALSPGYACAAWYLWSASGTIEADLASQGAQG